MERTIDGTVHGSVAMALVFALGLLMGGCAASPSRRAAAPDFTVEPVSSSKVHLSPARVWQEDGQIVIQGKVRRAPGTTSAGAGHTHLQVLSPQGEVLDEQWVPWFPKWIPFSGRKYSTYTVRYDRPVPPGSTIRVWVAYDDHAELPGEPEPAAPTATRPAPAPM